MMKHSVKELIELCYHYYPYGVGDDDPRYKDTEEHRRLVTACRRAGAAESPWRPMINHRLEARFPGLSVRNLSLHLPAGEHDGGYAGRLYLQPPGPEENFDSLEFRVSFLAPYYYLYSWRIPDRERGGERYEAYFDLLPEEQPYARGIIEEIEATFPGYEPMPREVGDAIVPGVVAGLKRMGEATLYHCLFTDQY
jgi:hypothetical protein